MGKSSFGMKRDAKQLRLQTEEAVLAIEQVCAKLNELGLPCRNYEEAAETVMLLLDQVPGHGPPREGAATPDDPAALMRMASRAPASSKTEDLPFSLSLDEEEDELTSRESDDDEWMSWSDEGGETRSSPASPTTAPPRSSLREKLEKKLEVDAEALRHRASSGKSGRVSSGVSGRTAPRPTSPGKIAELADRERAALRAAGVAVGDAPGVNPDYKKE